jgi:hypothetical protein
MSAPFASARVGDLLRGLLSGGVITNAKAGTTYHRMVVLSGLTLVACTGSPATLSMRPDFEATTLAGMASVSIRDPLPGLTYGESERLL